MKINFKYTCKYKDNYNIYNLIKKIDVNYQLLYDYYNKLFIIINSANNNEICFKTNKISPEIPKILQQSRVENSLKIFKKIDMHNEKIILDNNKQIKQKFLDSASNLVKFAGRTNKLTNKNINKIIEGKYA